MSFAALLVFISIYALAVATPGPGVAAVVARSLGRGMAGAAPFILGFVVGDLLWFIGAALGLSLLIAAYAPLFMALKYLGCLYLAFMAVQLWRAEAVLPDAETPAPPQSAKAAFFGSLFLTLGNPKVMLFFLSIMPLVVKPEAIDLGTGIILATTITIVISGILFGYMLLANRARRVFRSARAIKRVQKANAAVLAGAALLIASR